MLLEVADRALPADDPRRIAAINIAKTLVALNPEGLRLRLLFHGHLGQRSGYRC